MSRPRTPTNILELRGALKKDPQRRKLRANEPKPETAIGLPPDRPSYVIVSELNIDFWPNAGIKTLPNNPGSFDLWAEITFQNKTVVVGNWKRRQR